MKKNNAAEARYRKALLIDENEIDNFINERMITSCNFAEEVIVMDSGPAALKYLRDKLINKDQLPEIIFLDLNMPVMDGFGFLVEFDVLAKEHGNIKEDCKVIVLSSSISPIDIDKASTNPYVYKYINKPLSEKYLSAINI
jgi:CheY-like chemotaxis protein